MANKLQVIQAREPQAWASIRTQLQILETHGPVGKGFNQLRHIQGSVLWELRAQGRPAYRILFAIVNDKSEFVLLLVATKEDMTKTNLKNSRIDQALSHYEHWLEQEESNGEAT